MDNKGWLVSYQLQEDTEPNHRYLIDFANESRGLVAIVLNEATGKIAEIPVSDPRYRFRVVSRSVAG